MQSISVVIPSFNRGYCIKPCIESVLLQSFHDLEVVVVDDASKDDTRHQVMSIDDPRVRYIAHEVNRGGAAARNTGIQASQCELVAFLDSDDRWAPEKLEKQLQILSEKVRSMDLSMPGVYRRILPGKRSGEWTRRSMA